MKKFPLSLRIFHWLMAVVTFLLLGTVVMRKTIFEKLELAKELREFMASKSIALNMDDSVQLSVVIISKVWQYHFVIGIVFSILVLFRVILFFTPSGRGVLIGFRDFVLRRNKDANSFKYLVYVLFYLAAILLAITGSLMHLGNEWISHETKEALEAIHVSVINIIFLFIPIHIIGVVMGEKSSDKGIVSEMINGDEKE